jgi:hypothetical protein
MGLIMTIGGNKLIERTTRRIGVFPFMGGLPIAYDERLPITRAKSVETVAMMKLFPKYSCNGRTVKAL